MEKPTKKEVKAFKLLCKKCPYKCEGGYFKCNCIEDVIEIIEKNYPNDIESIQPIAQYFRRGY